MANPRRIEHGRGTSWEITYRVDGRMARRRFSTKKQALDALAQARVDTASGSAVLPAQSKVTVSAYGERWMKTLQVRPSTRAGYDNHLRVHIGPLLGSRPLSSLRRSDIAAFVAALVDRGLAPTTVRSIYNVLAMVLRSAVYDRLLAVSPCYRIKVPASTRSTLQVFTPEQVHQLLEAAWDCDRAVLATAVGTGLRQGDTLGLRAGPREPAPARARGRGAGAHPADRPAVHQPRPQDRRQPAGGAAPPVRRRRGRPAPAGVRRGGPTGSCSSTAGTRSGGAGASTTRSGSRRCAGRGCRRATASTRCGTRTPPG